MTEMVNGESQSSSNFAPPPVNSSPAPASTPAPESERTFKQSEVNDLVGRARHEAVERYKNDSGMAARQASQQQYQPNNGYVPPQQQVQGKSEEEIRRISAEESQRLRQEWIHEQRAQAEEAEGKRIAGEFFTKIEAGKANLPDFDKVMADVDLRTIPFHVQLANMVDNTADVMYELAKNPSKIGALQNLIDIDMRAGRQPKLALAEMKRLSDSIKENAKGSKFQSPNEPLSQLRPSNAGTGNQGALTVKDYKAKYRV